MPKGPKGERRPADAIGTAVMVGRIATGEIEDRTPGEGHAKGAHGQPGGKARAKSMSPKRRSEIARKAAQMRWEKD